MGNGIGNVEMAQRVGRRIYILTRVAKDSLAEGTPQQLSEGGEKVSCVRLGGPP